MTLSKQIYILCIILFTILFSSLFSDTSQTFSSNFYFRYLFFTLTIMVFLIVLCGLLLLYKWGNAITIPISVSNFLIVIYLFYYLINYYYKGSIYFDGFLPHVAGLMLIIILRQLKFLGLKLERVLLICFLIALLIQAGYGILQYAGLLKTTHLKFLITGTFYNQGIYGIWLSIAFPFALIGINHLQSKVLKYLCVVISSITLVAIYLSFSRTAWIAVLLSVLYLYRMPLKNYFLNRQKIIRYSIIFLLTVFSLSASWIIFSMKQDSAVGRLFIWKIGTRMISSNPISGIGPGGFERNYGSYLSIFFQQGKYSKTEMLLSERVDYAFNDYLQIFIEEGIIGGCIFITILISVFYWKSKKTIVEGARASLVALGIGCFFSYPLEDPSIWMSFILIIPCASYDISCPSFRIASNIFRTVTVLIIIITGWVIYSQVQIYHAKKKCFLAINKAWNNDSSSIHTFRSVYSLLKYDYTMMLPYAKVLSENGQFLQSNKQIQESKRLICDPFMYIIEGDNYLGMFEYSKAVVSYKKSISIDPKLIFPRYKLAKLYMKQYDTINACKIAEEILHMDIKVKSAATDNIQAEMIGVSYLCK